MRTINNVWPTFADKLRILIQSLEQGRVVVLDSGHILEWSPEHEAPGFSVVSSERGEMIMQIGSDVAWMSLIHHAKKMSEQDFIVLGANMALTDINRK